MTQALLDLLKLVKSIKFKTISFWSEIENEDFQNCEKFLKYLEEKSDEELTFLSQKFNISKSAAFMLAAVLEMYVKSDGIKLSFITITDLKNFFYPAFFANPIIFRKGIWELEEKNIIEITDIEHYPVKVFYKSDRSQNDYYLLPAKPSFMPFANKTFELTESFIEKLKQL